MSRSGFQQIALKEIASISLGYSFRSRVQSEPGGEVAVLQTRDLSSDAALSQPLSLEARQSLSYTQDSQRLAKYLLEPDDVLFQSRGSSMAAMAVPKDLGPAVAASPLMVLQLKTGRVNPAYLIWFLNQPMGQRQIQQRAGGTSIQMLNRSELREIRIMLPPLPVQQKLGELARLQEREQLLLQSLATKRRQYIDALLTQQVK